MFPIIFNGDTPYRNDSTLSLFSQLQGINKNYSIYFKTFFHNLLKTGLFFDIV